ncbi:hypothetical protein [Streptomyces sp. CAU 1734]|uniref:hypothetical protein n=1 Tax=Streptomyces sp. CAU 1734 TaxID=3140360 RepID=UPI003261261F
MTRHFVHCPEGIPGPPGVGVGCGHFEWLNLADSRPAYEAMREHLSGLHGRRSYTPEQVTDMLRDLRVYEPIKLGPKEKNCGALGDHDPHPWRRGNCYGNGPFRRVPKRETWPAKRES